MQLVKTWDKGKLWWHKNVVNIQLDKKLKRR